MRGPPVGRQVSVCVTAQVVQEAGPADEDKFFSWQRHSQESGTGVILWFVTKNDFLTVLF